MTTAFLVERDATAYQKLAQIPPNLQYSIKTYPADFLAVVPNILGDIPADAFSFFLVDPKVTSPSIQTVAVASHSEVIFNFMFDFITVQRA